MPAPAGRPSLMANGSPCLARGPGQRVERGATFPDKVSGRYRRTGGPLQPRRPCRKSSQQPSPWPTCYTTTRGAGGTARCVLAAAGIGDHASPGHSDGGLIALIWRRWAAQRDRAKATSSPWRPTSAERGGLESRGKRWRVTRMPPPTPPAPRSATTATMPNNALRRMNTYGCRSISGTEHRGTFPAHISRRSWPSEMSWS